MIICVVTIIAYGSLYPFDFRLVDIDPGTFQAFLASWRAYSSRGDILGNIALFVPLGLAGTITTQNRRRAWFYAILTLVGATALATALQALQLFLPSRTAALDDVLWNLLGTAIGCGFGMFLSKQVTHWAKRGERLELLPLLFLGCWIVLRLSPFVPSIDLQSIKNSLKPLLLAPDISLASVWMNVAGWLLAAFMMQRLTRRRIPGVWFAVIILFVFSLEVLVINNAVTASDVAGAGVAWFLAFLILRAGRNASLALSGILCTAIITRALTPFVLRPSPITFSWLPFADFLSGAMYHNALTIIGKIFLYGGLIYLLRDSGAPWSRSVGLTAILLALLEIAQIFFAYHSPSISDPVLAMLLGIVFMALSADGRPPGLKVTLGRETSPRSRAIKIRK